MQADAVLRQILDVPSLKAQQSSAKPIPISWLRSSIRWVDPKTEPPATRVSLSARLGIDMPDEMQALQPRNSRLLRRSTDHSLAPYCLSASQPGPEYCSLQLLGLPESVRNNQVSGTRAALQALARCSSEVVATAVTGVTDLARRWL